METVTILKMWLLNTDIDHWYPGTTDALVGCSGQCYCHPTIYVAACTSVGMFLIHQDAAGYEFNCNLRLHAKETVHKDYKFGKSGNSDEVKPPGT